MRKQRKLLPGAKYHVMIRANRDYCILDSPQNKALFLHTVQRARKKYTFNLRSFCILDNMVDMLIEPLEDANLSRIMQWIESVYAKAYNRLIDCRGHVWYDRFKSWIVSKIKRTCTLLLQIPVAYGLVNRPEEYQYSSINNWLMVQYGFCAPPG